MAKTFQNIISIDQLTDSFETALNNFHKDKTTPPPTVTATLNNIIQGNYFNKSGGMICLDLFHLFKQGENRFKCYMISDRDYENWRHNSLPSTKFLFNIADLKKYPTKKELDDWFFNEFEYDCQDSNLCRMLANTAVYTLHLLWLDTASNLKY